MEPAGSTKAMSNTSNDPVEREFQTTFLQDLKTQALLRSERSSEGLWQRFWGQLRTRLERLKRPLRA